MSKSNIAGAGMGAAVMLFVLLVAPAIWLTVEVVLMFFRGGQVDD